jgi:mannose-1-phosphate guanylyltransferase
MSDRPYVVILAGGEGSRLASLTRALYGRELPKQFAVLAGDRSLLQTTVERARALTTLDRIAVVVTSHQEAIARSQLADYPDIDLVVQPSNLDTAPALLLPLARILARDPGTRVVFLPSDHYIADMQPIIDALRAATFDDRIALLGVTPTSPEIEYGWIVRGAPVANTRAFAVRNFHEKPDAATAEKLRRRGALWNTFISTGRARVYWELAKRHLPRHAAALEAYAVAVGGLDETEALDVAYRTMAPANFSRDILEHAPLAVLPVSGTGWSDWGSPARVFASLAGSDDHGRLVDRIRGDLAFA